MKTRLAAYLTVPLFAITLFGSTVPASLIGDQVQVDMHPSSSWTVTSPMPTVIDPGVESFLNALSADLFAVDIRDSSITVTTGERQVTTGPDVLLTISDLDWLPTPGAITGFLFSISSDITGLDSTDVSFTDDSVRVAMHDAIFPAFSSFRIDLQVTHAGAVPELASVAVWSLLTSLGWTLGFRRKRVGTDSDGTTTFELSDSRV